MELLGPDVALDLFPQPRGRRATERAREGPRDNVHSSGEHRGVHVRLLSSPGRGRLDDVPLLHPSST